MLSGRGKEPEPWLVELVHPTQAVQLGPASRSRARR